MNPSTLKEKGSGRLLSSSIHPELSASESNVSWIIRLRQSPPVVLSCLAHLFVFWVAIRWLLFPVPQADPNPTTLSISLQLPGDHSDPIEQTLDEESQVRELSHELDLEAKMDSKIQTPIESQRRDQRIGLGGNRGRRTDARSRPLLDPSATLTVLERVRALQATRSSVFAHRTTWGRGQAVGRYGGTPESEQAVDLGLDWLAQHQSSDGRWDANGFHGRCRGGSRCSGQGLASFDPAQTGLAILAFLGVGQTHQMGEHKEVVRRGLEFLLSCQASSGLLDGDNEYSRQGNLYNHTISLLALAEAYGMTRDTRFLQPVARGIEFLARSQQSGGGWTYTPFAEEERNDSSITGFAVQAIKAALVAQVPVPEKLVRGVIRHFRQMTQADGSVVYADVGVRRNRQSRSLVAVGACSRLLLGLSRQNPIVRRQIASLRSHPPDWQRRSSIHNSYYRWYYGTLATFLAGSEDWASWNVRMHAALVKTQIRKGCAAGSWSTDSKWGPNGGRIYVTAINVLTLEIYYRYVPDYFQKEQGLARFWRTPVAGGEAPVNESTSRRR
ncbi:MAG: terpene cyclase/mutase family protein [Planctomycetota bacterium]|nr:terpene cyclase/mutase family protein [Planctomycetota bacterium]